MWWSPALSPTHSIKQTPTTPSSQSSALTSLQPTSTMLSSRHASPRSVADNSIFFDFIQRHKLLVAKTWKARKKKLKNKNNKSKAALIIALAHLYKQIWAPHFNRNDKLQVKIHAYQEGDGYKRSARIPQCGEEIKAEMKTCN